MSVLHDIGPVCLITGGAGFFGRVLTRRLLDEGYRVRVLDVASHPLLDPRAELVRADLRDAGAVARAVRGASTVFHAAALIELSGIASAATKQRVRDVNIGGTENVIAACKAEGARKLVYTSTNNVLFDREIVGGDERDNYAERFVDLYTETKVESEKRVLAAGKAGELFTCALRPGGIWGPYPGGMMLDKVLDQLSQGTFVARIGSGGLADNTHVENLVDAELLAARALCDKPELVSGEAYFVTDGEPMDPVDWFGPLLTALGYELPKRKIPGALMYGLGYALEWLHRVGGPRPLVTRIEVLKVTRAHSFKIDKAKEHLGYEPRIRSGEGLLACVPFARAYLAAKKGPALTHS